MARTYSWTLSLAIAIRLEARKCEGNPKVVIGIIKLIWVKVREK